MRFLIRKVNMNNYSYELLFITSWSGQERNEKRANENLLQILHQPRKPHQTGCDRATLGETYECKRTCRGAWTRTKHDFTQSQTPPPMQPYRHKKSKAKNTSTPSTKKPCCPFSELLRTMLRNSVRPSENA